MLSTAAEFEVVGDASNSEGALRDLPRLKPDLVLIDVEMPGMDGAVLASRLRRLVPEAKLLAWTVSEAGDDLVRMLAAGCCGYVLKDCGAEEMRRALLAALRDDAPIPRKMVHELIGRVVQTAPDVPPPRLTKRETDVLRQLARGLARKEIASQLGISIASVDSHFKSLYVKLDASSQTEALTTALRIGIISLSDL